MTDRALATNQPNLAEAIEQVVVQGDLAKLSPDDRLAYYRAVCDSLGLNPLTQPFAYITLSGKLTLYAKRDCTDQLRRVHGVSVEITSRERLDDVYVVTARATTPAGRSDESIGAVSIAGLKGEALANAYMKTETKAKRRATLSLCGLGMLDETETETIPGAVTSDQSRESVTVSERPSKSESPKPVTAGVDWEQQLRDAPDSQQIEYLWRVMKTEHAQTKALKAVMLECWGRALLREEANRRDLNVAALVSEMRRRGIEHYSDLDRERVSEIGDALGPVAPGAEPMSAGEYDELVNVDLETGEVLNVE